MRWRPPGRSRDKTPASAAPHPRLLASAVPASSARGSFALRIGPVRQAADLLLLFRRGTELVAPLLELAANALYVIRNPRDAFHEGAAAKVCQIGAPHGAGVREGLAVHLLQPL